jgi:flap endonuclease-1
MALNGDAWAVGSQDYDALLFGAPRLVKGLTLSGKMELALIELDSVLAQLGVTREQLIDIAILVGTDFNPGVHGIGPKKALKAVKEGRFREIEVDFDFDEVRRVFLDHPTTDDYKVAWGRVDADGLVDLLSKQHDFSEERVRRAASELAAACRENTQQSLSRWF